MEGFFKGLDEEVLRTAKSGLWGTFWGPLGCGRIRLQTFFVAIAERCDKMVVVLWPQEGAWRNWQTQGT